MEDDPMVFESPPAVYLAAHLLYLTPGMYCHWHTIDPSQYTRYFYIVQTETFPAPVSYECIALGIKT